MTLFGKCDYVVSATRSPNFTLTRELVEGALERPVVLIDLAVPRDIDPGVRTLPGVRFYDIDCFRREACGEKQRRAIEQAERCFEEQMEEFFVWYECKDVIPKIQRIKEEAAHDLELRLTKKMLRLEAEEREAMKEDISAAMVKTVNKMLFGLRDRMSRGAFLECLEGLERIYEES